jgi:dUTP pyrophosphatase
MTTPAKYHEPPVLQWCKIDPAGPGLHSPKLPGDVGWDLAAAEEVVLEPRTAQDVLCNVRVKLPEDCWGEIRARSSIARRGLQVDAGVLDNGYTGPLFVLLRNVNRLSFAGPAVRIKKGDRIGQLVLHWAVWAQGIEVPEIVEDDRRGSRAFGSTGK